MPLTTMALRDYRRRALVPLPRARPPKARSAPFFIISVFPTHRLSRGWGWRRIRRFLTAFSLLFIRINTGRRWLLSGGFTRGFFHNNVKTHDGLVKIVEVFWYVYESRCAGLFVLFLVLVVVRVLLVIVAVVGAPRSVPDSSIA